MSGRLSVTVALALLVTCVSANAQDTLPDAQQAAAPEQNAPAKPKVADPFAFADFTWLTGNPRTKDAPLDSPAFTGEFRVDTNYTFSFNHPQDDTISGSSEIFRSGEVQLTQLGIGGDFHYDNVRGRLMTQFGLYSQTTPRNDASPARGQWNLDSAYRYISEAYGGYHWDKMHGINVDAGIFMSYVGLDSYYQFDNWVYQPSYVSSNTPWFFNGVRIQFFPTDKLKIEPWIINGWQSYGRFNNAPGLGGQILWRPNGSVSILANNYWGKDALGNPDRKRVHTDDSIQVKYYDSRTTRSARPRSRSPSTPAASPAAAWSAPAARRRRRRSTSSASWPTTASGSHNDLYALTVGGGAINNPGRYLVLLPPINGATAASGTPYFTENPGDPYKAWDMSVTATTCRASSSRSGSRATIAPRTCRTSPAQAASRRRAATSRPSARSVAGWAPDLRKSESRMTAALLVKF